MQNIDESAEQFKQKAEEVKAKLENIISRVSDGRIPAEQELEDAENGLSLLRSTYKDIVSAAKEMLTEEELPDADSPVSAYTEAVKNSRMREFRIRFEKITNALSEFVSVRSDIQAYADAIKSAQDEAAELLRTMNAKDFDALTVKSAASKSFMKAFHCANISGSEGLDLMEEVNRHFPFAASIGLVGHQYYLGSQKDAQTVQIPEEKPKSHKSDEINTDVREDASTEVLSSGEETRISAHEEPVRAEFQPVAKEISAVNKVKTGNPSASSFQNEIRKLARANGYVKAVLPLLSHLGALTKRQIFEFALNMESVKDEETIRSQVGAAADLLAAKSFCAHYKSVSGEDIYGLGGYAAGCLGKDSVKRWQHFWAMNIGRCDRVFGNTVSEEVLIRTIQANDNLYRYLATAQNGTDQKTFDDINSRISWRKEYYRAGVFWDGSIFTGVVVNPWNEPADIAEENIIMSDEADLSSISLSQAVRRVFVFGENGIQMYDAADGAVIKPETMGSEADNEAFEVEEDVIGKEVEDSSSKSGELVKADELDNVGPNSGNTSGEEERGETADQSGSSVKDGKGSEPDHAEKQEEAFSVVLPETNVQKECDTEILVERESVPSDEEFCDVILKTLSRKAEADTDLKTAVVDAVLLAKCAGLEKDRSRAYMLSMELSAASRLFIEPETYGSTYLAKAFPEPEKADQAVLLAAYLNALLTPSVQYDFSLASQAEQFFESYELYFEDFPQFKKLFNSELQIKDASPAGFSSDAVMLLGSEQKKQTYVDEIRLSAKECLNVKRPAGGVSGIANLYKNCFEEGSDLYECMQIIADDNRDYADYVQDILSDFCVAKDEEFAISENILQNRLDEEWSKVNSKMAFHYYRRDQAVGQFRKRLEIMRSWILHVRSESRDKAEIQKLHGLKDEILGVIDQIQADSSWRTARNANILAWMLQYTKEYLDGRLSNLDVFSDFAYSGIWQQDDTGKPIIDASMCGIKFYEPWRRALKQILYAPRSADEVISDILGDDTGIDISESRKDNLHQLKLLGRLLKDDSGRCSVAESTIKESSGSADIACHKFDEDLELAYTYDRINETQKETLNGIVQQYKQEFYNSLDFACLRDFFEALRRQISIYTHSQREKLGAYIDTKLKDEPDSILLIEAKVCLDRDENFAAAEEYINRYEAKDTEFGEALGRVTSEPDYYQEFLRKDVSDAMYKECNHSRGQSFRKVAWKYLENRLPEDWTNRNREECKTLVQNWPVAGSTSPENIAAILRGLGFDVTQAFPARGRAEKMYDVVVAPSPRSQSDYTHPIASFGTQMKQNLPVIVLNGSYTDQQLVDTVTGLNLGQTAIVLLDAPVQNSNRRHIGEIFHTQKSGRNRFLLIDQVLFLFLAMHQKTERLPAMLRCTLPYSTYQPFVFDGGPTADEMFCGRTSELQTIIDPNGASVVYGGRQLGKTAILERAESLCSRPDKKQFAVYSSILHVSSETEVVSTLANDIYNKTDKKINLKRCSSMKEICSELSGLFRSGKVVSMHLFIDEVDDFLSAIADDSYKQLQPLVNLKRETKNAFKFVLTGLHNVFRAENAMKNNGLFGQLGEPLCIGPLSPTDAMRLISRPLGFLGFEIDRYPHLETILIKTNYYPGILQFFGYQLVETLTKSYSKYYSAADGNPPFALSDEQLGSVMSSAQLNKSIKEKFKLSLELDPRYFMIARCITMLYHLYDEDRTFGSWLGFKVDQIIELADEYEIYCLEGESRNGYLSLLDEMVGMGILSRPAEGYYRLRRRSFINIIGENMEVLDEDIRNNTEDA